MQSTLATERWGATQEEPASCRHCGLPVVGHRFDPEAAEQFCCSGCRAARALLTGAGLDGYYELRERIGESGRAVGGTSSDFEQFDSDAFRELYCRPAGEGKLRVELQLEGVHCAACVWLVERLPRLEPAVEFARLNLAQSVVEIQFRVPGENASTLEKGRGARLSEIARTLQRMGYRPRPRRGLRAAELHREQLRGLLIRVGVAGASAGNVMLMAFALYAGADADLASSTMGVSVRSLFQWASLVVSIPALLAGGVFFRGAWTAVRTMVPHMDLPIAIGIIAGFGWGTFGVISGRGEIYFDSITALIFLLLVGRYLQARHQIRGAEAAELLLSVVPGEVLVLLGSDDQPVESAPERWDETKPSGGGEKLEGRGTARVPIDDVLPGSLVVVDGGEVVPVDGVVAAGRSSLDRSLLSGESLPTPVTVGDRLEAGCVNLGGRLTVRVERAGRQSRIARLMQEVERAQRTRSPTIQMADRIAGVFTVAVLGLSLVTLGVFWHLGSEEAISRALSLLVVACPCALGLATPLSLSSAVSQAARSRTLVFSPEALEVLALPCLIVLDKTGTLTEGRLSVANRVGDPAFDPVVLSLERGASHPAGAALRTALLAKGVAQVPLDGEVQELLGSGRKARYGGSDFLLGSQRFVLEVAHLPEALGDALRRCPDSWSPVLLARDGIVISIFFLEDKIAPDARESLLQLRQQGHRLAILSGDRALTVSAVAATLRGGVEDLFEFVVGDCSPEDKLARIRALVRAGKTPVMVGDGINDAAALSAARVGVAVSGAAEACQLSSDIFVASAGVSHLRGLFEGAARLRRTIRRGVVFSLCYNLIGVSLAAFGFLGPLGAAILMPLSSLTVISHAMRSRIFPASSDSP